MTDTNITLFIDTNSFLQLKDFNQIAWRTLFPSAKTITLFVCSAVIAELDKHKVSTNRRRRDRARKALHLIEEAAALPGMALVVKEAAPRVDIAIWRGNPNWLNFPDLDAANPDDYLVAAAATTPAGIVFSHDTGPRIRARIAGVRAEGPPDHWLLAEEQTDDQRKIGQLTRELEAARNDRPRLQFIIPTDEPMKMKVSSMPSLGPKATKRLNELVLAAFPKRHLFPRVRDRFSILSDPDQLQQTQIDAYEKDYESFSSNVHTYFVTLHERVEKHAFAQMLPGAIVNIGGVSAKNLLLTIETEGNVELLADRDDAQSLLGRISLPDAPKPPRARRTFDSYPPLSGINKSRNPTRFYWLKRPAVIGAHLARFECADFRPGHKEDFGVLVRADSDLPCAGWIVVSASAEHHETVTSRRAIIFERAHAGWLDPVVQGMLPETVRKAFASIEAADLPAW